MTRRRLGGLVVVAALAMLVLYALLRSDIDDVSYLAQDAADEAGRARSEIEELRSEVDDLESRFQRYRYGYGY